MIKRIAIRACLLGLTVSLLAAQAACGESGDSLNAPLSLRDYVQRLSAIGIEAQRREDAFANPFEGPFESEDGSLPEARLFAENIGETLDYTLDEVQGLNPPELATAAHEDFVDALAAYRELWQEFETMIVKVTTAEAFNRSLLGFFNSNEQAAAGQRIDVACAMIKELADREGIEADICN